MPSFFRDPKTLAEWIQLDYFRKPGRFWKIRNVVTWLVFITCLALITLTWPSWARFVYESRPVSSAHAMLNDNCGVCHAAASFQPAMRLLRSDPSVRSVPNDTCRACHPVGPHHEECVQDPDCSICHQEHRGRTVLARVADSYCTTCHADLDKVCPSRGPFAAKVGSFVPDHPPFGAWRGSLVDPGTVRFNHMVHLNLNAESVRGIDKPLADLQEQQCAYCHQRDPAGRYMKPIVYDQHCSQCHALSVAVTGNWREESVRSAAERFAHEPAPHKDPLTVRAALRERFTRFVRDNPSVLRSQEATEPPRWVPGRPREQLVLDKESLWVHDQLQTAEHMVFYGANGCRYCHQIDAARGRDTLPQYLPSSIRSVWFPHSIFSHQRHRMLLCTECHPAPTSSATKDVLLPTIEDCQRCHNPSVGARSDCAECHRYHDRSKETFEGRKTILECLQRE
jgi:hypothetical protein